MPLCYFFDISILKSQRSTSVLCIWAPQGAAMLVRYYQSRAENGHCVMHLILFVPLYFSFNLKRQHFTHRQQAGGSWVRTWCGSCERSARGWPCATGPPAPRGGASRCTCCGRSSTGMVRESTCCRPSARCQTARSALARTGGRWCHLPTQQTLDVRLRLHVCHQHKCLKSLSNTP